MAWEVRLTSAAEADLTALDNAVAARVVEKIESAATNPHHFFERLRGSEYRKLRVGDYRIIALFIHQDDVIEIQRIEHRSRVYGRS